VSYFFDVTTSKFTIERGIINMPQTQATEETKKAPKKITKAAEKSVKKEVKAAAKKPAGVPTTMEELLSMTGYTLKAPKPGEVLEGMITDISRRMVLVDIGAKTEGMVVDKEFAAARDLIDDLSVGDEVAVYVLSPENDRGQILLSLKRALIDRKWAQFAEYLETGESVEVIGLEVNKGGMIVMAGGIRGFVPSSQFGSEYLGRMERLLNESFKVKVIEVNKEKNRLIFSERHVSEAEAIAKKSEALSFVEENSIYEGVVSGIMPFGVFVGVEIPLSGDRAGELGKVEGLVHISEISWEKVNDPNDYFKLGDRMKVRVLGIDEDAGKLNLSVKQMTDDPWTTVPQKYPQGAKVTGRVTRTAPFGVFVTLEPGVDGLIHISKIPSTEEPKVGQEIEVYVESVDMDQRRMSLGIVLTEVPIGYK
jgi:small subunit ribosomal protein S1